MVSRFLAWLLLVSAQLAMLHCLSVLGLQSTVPASFVFGDSLVDSGNNNYIESLSKANSPPNGIDFPGGEANGRFTNGRTVVDIIGESFGLPFAPPYLAPSTKGEAILKGVNYASGGGGILDETGVVFIGRLSLWKQIQYFANTTNELRNMLGAESAANLLAKSIVSVTIGANDYLNNYLSPVPLTTDTALSPQQYQERLLSNFRRQIIALYDLGARKIVISAVGPIGCTPYQLTLNIATGGTCVPYPNTLVRNLNTAIKEMVVELNANLPQVFIVYGNTYDVVLKVVTNPQSYGFDTSNQGCCGLGGPYKGLIPCSPSFPLCPDRSKSFFWDPYHPSQSANVIIADRYLNGNSNDIFPFNLNHLATL
ncbi:hypothetical protein O6H91_14G048800 [Diphasiastrum complanatum]|uniref:Uncharacterized protein n=1 Tax=Diphasiastrum complanatum TaxID=34168 RepID=A0ACC2BP69_DIPCM|nr:hypothetical protein O6H91_14G048800 [Diphasiastrum complanatum]